MATATLPIPADAPDAKAYVLDTAGFAIVNLKKVEAGITAALEEIKGDRELTLRKFLQLRRILSVKLM